MRKISLNKISRKNSHSTRNIAMAITVVVVSLLGIGFVYSVKNWASVVEIAPEVGVEKSAEKSAPEVGVEKSVPEVGVEKSVPEVGVEKSAEKSVPEVGVEKSAEKSAPEVGVVSKKNKVTPKIKYGVPFDRTNIKNMHVMYYMFESDINLGLKRKLSKSEYKIFRFDNYTRKDYRNVIAKIKKAGYRPANLNDLVNYAEEHVNKNYVAALGEDFTYDYPVVTIEGGGKRTLRLRSGSTWTDKQWVFLAVKNK